jgi:hypothetical protein
VQKFRVHNDILNSEKLDQKKIYQTQYLNPKIIVDVNKLLNRIKIEERNQTKRKIIFFSSVTLGLGCVGTLISIFN